MSSLERNAVRIAALADPVRRALYDIIAAAAEPVSRDQAADAVGIARHQAKFHLDKLEAEGLLESDYVRLTGRSGPGAGRTAKRYRRTPGDIEVSVPPRAYRLASQLMADAIAEASTTDTPAAEALNRVAHEFGMTAGQTAAASHPPADPATALDLLTDALDGYGYQPQPTGSEVYLTNCPFHTLAQTQTQVACAMSHALVSGVAAAMVPHCPQVRLHPAPGRCCVVLARASG